MNFMLLVLPITFVVFLFSLYYFSKDDFTIIRKDISLEKIFNVAFLTSLISLLSARIAYIVLSGSRELFHPLKFFDLPHFPGLSLIGGLTGFVIFTFLYTKYKNLPSGKISDLLTMSLITSMPIGFFLTFLFSFIKTPVFFNIMFIFSIIIFFLFAKIVFSFSTKGEIEDGSLGLMFITIFSFLYFTTKLFLDTKNFSLISGENLMLFFLLFSSIIVLINKEIVDKFLSKK